MVLSCEALAKTYGSITAISDVSMSVRAGEVVGFLGPNGAGKTTTLLTILGLVRATSGVAEILGEAVPAGREVMRQVGVMFERPAFYPWMSGRRNLRVLSGGVEESSEEIERTLQQVGLGEASSKKVRTYSAGMRQRLALALALIGNPRLLILDEPSNGLDPSGIRMFRGLIADVARNGSAVLLSSHQLSEVERACDRVVIIKQGRTVASGTPQELGKAGASVVHVVVSDEDAVRALDLLAGFKTESRSDGVIVVEAESGRLVTEALARGQVFPHSVEESSHSLEEVFFELTESDSEA